MHFFTVVSSLDPEGQQILYLCVHIKREKNKRILIYGVLAVGFKSPFDSMSHIIEINENMS